MMCYIAYTMKMVLNPQTVQKHYIERNDRAKINVVILLIWILLARVLYSDLTLFCESRQGGVEGREMWRVQVFFLFFFFFCISDHHHGASTSLDLRMVTMVFSRNGS